VFAVAFNEDGSRVASGSRRLRVWDTASGEQITAFKAAGDWIVSLAYSPDGRRIVTNSVVDLEDPDIDTIEVWDAESGRQISSWQADGRWGSFVFSPEGTEVIGSDSRSICIWDANSGEKLASYAGYDTHGSSIAVFGDGERIVTGGGSVRVWDLATGEPLLVLRGHEYSVGNVAVSRDGRRVVSGAQDGSVRIWDTPPDYVPGRPASTR
ncbi:MAG: WD40 repeat domain-containing protein, partial [Planctomycetota bacterium]